MKNKFKIFQFGTVFPKLSEYFRLWKIVTYSIGLTLLIIGGKVFKFDDWDTGISIVMSSLTYFFAPISVRALINGINTTVLKEKISCLVLSLFLTWLTVDGSYYAYWSIINPNALYMRSYQWPLSLMMFLFCGFLWLFSGSCKETVILYKEALQRLSSQFSK